MDNLKKAPTKTTPKIEFEPEKGHLMISGESYPENSAEFYAPVIKWLNDYLEKKPNITFVFKLIYFNTSSSKALLDILDILDEYHKKGGKVKVKWMYQPDDEDILETGEDFLEDLDLPYEFETYD